MKNILIPVLAIVVLVSCTTDKKGSMLVTGDVKGLKKGTLYLQKMNDSIVIAVDSIVLDGVSTFTLSDEIESPEIYYLALNNDPKKKILFFGDIGTIDIQTKLDKFSYGASITGLKNQQLLDDYNDMIKDYRDRNLELIEVEFEVRKSNDSLKIDSVQKLFQSLIKSRYRYTINYAITNADAEVAPYLALTELYNANIVWLDSVNNSLSKEVKSSKYGKRLDTFISEIKSKE
jgi:hypothetical protein